MERLFIALTAVSFVAGQSGQITSDPSLLALFDSAQPIWHRNASAEFVILRHHFDLPASSAASAGVLVTARASPPRRRKAGSRDQGSALLGAYQLFINGVAVAAGPGRKGNNQSQPVDFVSGDLVWPLLRPGHHNIVALQCYYNVASGSDRLFDDDAPRVRLALGMYDDAGAISIRIATSASSWEVMNADPVFNPRGDVAGGSYYTDPLEDIDMRALPADAFNASGELSVSATWEAAIVAPDFVSPTVVKLAQPVLIGAMTAPDVEKWNVTQLAVDPTTGLRHYFVDFGREFMGGVSLSAWLPPAVTSASQVPADTIEVRCGEELWPNGTVRWLLRALPDSDGYREFWTFRSGLNIRVRRHEYWQFRFCELLSVPAQLVVLGKESLLPEAAGKAWIAVSAWTVRYEFERRAELTTLTTSDSNFNDVFKLCQQTILSDALDTNTDSNTRQRDGCTVDAWITSAGQYALTGDPQLPLHTAQYSLGPLGGVATWWSEFHTAAVSMAHEAVSQSGVDQARAAVDLDDRLADGSLFEHSLLRFMDAETGLIRKLEKEHWAGADGQQYAARDLVDWPTGSRDGFDFGPGSGPHSTAVNSAIAAGCASRMADLVQWLQPENVTAVETYANTSVRLRQAVLAQLFDHQTGRLFDALGSSHQSQHAMIYAAEAGVFDADVAGDDVANAAAATLAADVGSRGMVGSPYSAFPLLRGLYRLGRRGASGSAAAAGAAAAALEVMLSDGPHSWRAMLRAGATTTWEVWSPQEKSNMDFSHPWATAPATVAVNDLMGIMPLEPGFTLFAVSPQPAWLARGAIARTTASGVISVAFAQDEHGFALNVSVPSGARARLCLPSVQLPSDVTIPSFDDSEGLVLDGREVTATHFEGHLLCASEDLHAGLHVAMRSGSRKYVSYV